MAEMGLEALHPRPKTTVATPDARSYPYLLRDRELTLKWTPFPGQLGMLH
jgi:hypothetical protein